MMLTSKKLRKRLIKLFIFITLWIHSILSFSDRSHADQEIEHLTEQIFSSETEKALLSNQQKYKLNFMMITTAESTLAGSLGAISHFFNTPFNPERIRMEEIRQQILEVEKIETAEVISEKIRLFKSDQRNFEFVPGATPGMYDTDLRYEAKTSLADLEAQLYKARSDGNTKDGVRKKIDLLNQQLQHVAQRGLISHGLRQIAKISRFIAWSDGIMVAVDILGAGVMTFLLDIEPLPFLAVRSGHKFLSPLPKEFFEMAKNFYSDVKKSNLTSP